MIKKAEKKEEGAPAYMLTYGDMMTLLLCFFVILVAMSEIKEDRKYDDVVRSIQEAFGYAGGVGRIRTDMAPLNSSLDKTRQSMHGWRRWRWRRTSAVHPRHSGLLLFTAQEPSQLSLAHEANSP